MGLLVYNILLASLSLLGVCLCWKKRSRFKDGLFLVLAFFVLTALSAARFDIGYDYGFIYLPSYRNFLLDPSAPIRFEPGFQLLMRLTAFFSQNYQMLFVVASVITVGLALLFYWLYSPNVFVSVFLFVALSHYYCSFNFMRQMIAAAIALFAFPLLKKRTLPAAAGYFAVVLLAASFHKSALILIPFFFINLIPLTPYVLAAYGAVTAAVYFNSRRIIEVVTRYWYTSYPPDNIHMQAAFEFQFAIAVGVIFLFLFLFQKKLKEPDRSNGPYLNYAFFTLFFVLMGTRHSILDRLSMYFELTAPVALAIVLHQLSQQAKGAEPDGRRAKAVLASAAAVVFVGGAAIHQYALTKDYHHVTPYQSVLGQPLYREYVQELKDGKGELLEPDDQIPMPDPPDAPDLDEIPPPEIQASPDMPDGMPLEVPFDEF